MLKIQLLLEDQEVELGQNVSIPLNKTFENLENPTDIISEYSKSINIPLTSRNNEILSNSYRLDRTVIAGDTTSNIGLYLDPSKRIPMKILYNSSVVLEGYAKFASTNNSSKNGYYTLNLFGVLGDIFQKLRSVVLSESQLSEAQKSEEDGGKKYILDDRSASDGETVNADYVHRSFQNDYNNIYGHTSAIDVIGFAPSYRGYYNEFDSKKIQVLSGDSYSDDQKFINIDKYLTDKWSQTYKNANPSATVDQADAYAESLGADDIVGDGFKDYQMKEYRAYMMKPYIYFNQLLQMYQDQIKKLSDYELELDTNWFNVNNPYWTRMCYMLDYLDSRDGVQDVSEQITNIQNFDSSVTAIVTDSSGEVSADISLTIENDYIQRNSSIVLNPFDVNLKIEALGPNSVISGGTIDMIFPKSTYFRFRITFIADGVYQYRYTYASFYDYNDVKNYITDDTFTENNFVKLGKPVVKWEFIDFNDYIQSGSDDDLKTGYYMNLTIPIDGVTIDFNVNPSKVQIITEYLIKNNTTPYLFANRLKINNMIIEQKVLPDDTYNLIKGTVAPFYMKRSWRDDIQVSLSNIYYKEDSPLFDIILQYTKMFGLIWDVDYLNKKVKIVHKSTYFNNYTVEDWSDRVDRSKDFIIEPITFNTKGIKFNYDDVDGYGYTSYRDKYGVNIGDKSIATGYEFGDETKDLFKGISPSSASSKSFIDFNSWFNWDLTNRIPQTLDANAFIDAEDEDEASSISIYNWYLRGRRKSIPNSLLVPYYITDDTVDMKASDEYCWIASSLRNKNGYFITDVPTFNLAINEPNLFPQLQGRVLSCVFNTPNEDRTSTKLISKSLDNSIYDLFWKRFITERYNIQNKKVTAYIHIPSEEFLSFSFNKFVAIDNQLFIVNKIMDYDLNNTLLTKVELVQITDPTVYTDGSESFPPVVISPNEIDIIGSHMGGRTGSSIGIVAHITYFDEEGEPTRGDWGELQGTLYYADGTSTSDPSEFDYHVHTEYGVWESKIGRDSMYLYWDEMTDLRFIGSIVYNLPDKSITIPITIDYTR